VIEKMQRLGFLDDARVARSRVHTLRGRGDSKRKIAQRLRHQGVTTDDVNGALADEGRDAELEAARTYARRRRLHARDRHKALAALARQGFSFDVARRALDVNTRYDAAAAHAADAPDAPDEAGA
jgi:regulatory protein